MSKMQIVIDASMCLLWMTTYTLVLLGTIKYRYPLISPITQVIIAPFEFSVLFCFVRLGNFGFDYVSMAYLYWTLIEIAIIMVMLKNGYIKKKYRALYIILAICITAIMVYLVAFRGQIFFFSYLNTFIGVIIWLAFVIKRKDYPMKTITLAIFIVKFIADVLGFIVYNGYGSWVENAMCILLPIIDFLFILLYLKRKNVVAIE